MNIPSVGVGSDKGQGGDLIALCAAVNEDGLQREKIADKGLHKARRNENMGFKNVNKVRVLDKEGLSWACVRQECVVH